LLLLQACRNEDIKMERTPGTTIAWLVTAAGGARMTPRRAHSGQRTSV